MNNNTFRCNRCWNTIKEPSDSCYITACLHLFCLRCGDKISEQLNSCPCCKRRLEREDFKEVNLQVGFSNKIPNNKKISFRTFQPEISKIQSALWGLSLSNILEVSLFYFLKFVLSKFFCFS